MEDAAMGGEDKTPRYAIRLIVVVVSVAVVFFVGLQLFVPQGSRLTGSYDAESLIYIASAPVAYRGSQSCGSSGCHESVYNTWLKGAHGSREEQSKCEVCHGPQGAHPEQTTTIVKVRGDGDIVGLCLSCHQKMKARGTTGQPQIVPTQHPYPHEGTLNCTKCHNPHAPAIGGSKATVTTEQDAAVTSEESKKSNVASVAENCFGCHGPSGRGGFAPELAGQSYDALKSKLTKLRSGEIESPVMAPIASGLKDEEIDVLAKFFAGIS